MILVIKKITVFFVALMLLFSVTVSADEEFFVYGKNNSEISEALGLTQNELKDYCDKNKITYFAVNRENTKQIKKTEFTDKFSQKAVDLSVLGDNEILKLSGEISGFSKASGEIVKHNGFKLLKLRLESEDGGGKYILTQYITVKNAKKIILTFYTAKGEGEEYIDRIFREQFKEKTDYKPFIIISVVVFAFIAIVVAVFIIKDLKSKE